jgi:hypothetical protein
MKFQFYRDEAVTSGLIHSLLKLELLLFLLATAYLENDVFLNIYQMLSGISPESEFSLKLRDFQYQMGCH